jgi:hypothetical protein
MKTGCLILPDRSGFFRSKDEAKAGYQLITPAGVLLRSGRADNEPYASDSFWMEALQLEFKQRKYKALSDDSIPGGWWVTMELPGEIKKRYYAVLFQVRGKRIEALEAYFPDEKSYSDHADTVRDMFVERRMRRWSPACWF